MRFLGTMILYGGAVLACLIAAYSIDFYMMGAM